MNGFLIFYAIVLWIANIIFCGWLAEQKDRNVIGWCFLGAIFPGLAIVAIAGATENLRDTSWNSRKANQETINRIETARRQD